MPVSRQVLVLRLTSFNRSLISTAILSFAVAPGFCAGPNSGTTSGTAVPLGVSSTWTGDSTSDSGSDNSGRQLAVAYPLIPHSVSLKVPTVPVKLGSGRVAKSAPKKDQVIKIVVPASVDETADVCRVGLKRATVVGQQKAKELCQWALAVHKQMIQTPTMTPLGGPYATPSYAQTKLFYTHEGRLKTVVKR